MDVDSPLDQNPLSLSPRDRILARLKKCCVPEERLQQLQQGLVVFAKENKSALLQLVFAILPSAEEVCERVGSQIIPTLREHYKESILWLQWLMFEEEPNTSLNNLAKLGVSQRGVCGAVWGKKDIAYRCRTCEHDPTCAICVSCFQDGNHKGHDYSIIYTGGGCCDCGDVTAWKREGFCSQHKGAEQVQPLPEHVAESVGPVLDALFVYWRETLLASESTVHGSTKEINDTGPDKNAADIFSSVVVKMLLKFCDYSESLLAFVSRQMVPSAGLLDILVRSERFLDKKVVKKLHELLLKLLGEPMFKYEFAKAFISYYPLIVKEATIDGRDLASEKYQLLSTFSVQIFTVSTLTPRLVRELNLLGILLECLVHLFLSCSADGCLQVSKWVKFYDITVRLLEDIRFVMSHVEVRKNVVQELQVISQTWTGLLTLVQGMDPQRRAIGLHVEEENENVYMPFVIGHFLGNIHFLLVAGAFAADSSDEMTDGIPVQEGFPDLDDDDRRHAKVGRLSQESSVSSTSRSSLEDSAQLHDARLSASYCSVPSSVSNLIFECLRAIERWLRLGAALRRLSNTSSSSSNAETLKNVLFKMNKRTNVSAYIHPSGFGTDVSGDSMSASMAFQWKVDPSFMNAEGDGSEGHTKNDHQFFDVMDMDLECMEGKCSMEVDGLGLLSMKDWPEILYDVSSQDISFHIPLHRLLSLLLQKALERSYRTSRLTSVISSIHLPGHFDNFFGQILKGCHPCGFSAFMMEHPLQLRVFCAQVHAGMWRKNGDAGLLCCEYYRSVRWWEQSLEFDLFLLQCCAALAPADLFVKRIQERFGLKNYYSLSLERPNEYEPVLVQEMLTLIIQIVKERRFCGLSTVESLRRELVCRLAIGDATHSQLLKALPDDLSKSDDLQKIVDTLALYSNPSVIKQGKYSLRKACWKELDLYHPRWNSRDLQIAEERYLQFCKVSALTTQLPRWTDIFHPLNTISRIATCREVLQIIRAVLFYAVFSDKSSASRSPDEVLLTALHLTSLALDICSLDHLSGNARDREKSFPILAYATEEIYLGVVSEANAWKRQSMLSLLVSLERKYRKENYNNVLEASQCDFSPLIENVLKSFMELDTGCMTELQRIAPDVVLSLLEHPSSSSIKSSMSASDAERKAKARERQAAILQKMRSEQAKFISSIKFAPSSEPDSISEVSTSDNGPEKASSVICSLCRDPDSRSPLSYLVLLQKSRLTSFLERGPTSWDTEHTSDKDHAIVSNELTGLTGSSTLSTRLEALPSANSMHLPSIQNIQFPNASDNTWMDVASPPETVEDEIYQSIRKTIEDTISHSHDDSVNLISFAEEAFGEETCIKSVVLGEYLAALARETSKMYQALGSGTAHGGNASSKSPFQHLPFDGFGPIDCDGIHVSSCGHAVHLECRDRYLSSLRQRFIRRIVFEGGHAVDPDQGELLCPVCRRLANSILPSFPQVSSKLGKKMMLADGGLLSITGCSSSNLDGRSLHVPLALSLLYSSAKVVGNARFRSSKHSNGNTGNFVESIFRDLSNMYYSERHDNLLASGRASQSLLFWDTLRYSLISAEIAARSRKPNNLTSGLESLCKEVKTSSGFLLSLLLQAAQATRSQNHLQVLLRCRGVQLFMVSICSGISEDEVFKGGQIDSMSILKLIDIGIGFPDIQFWKRAADPVLAHDPFSSLAWVLFCLPMPILSCMEYFKSLVHLFYVVCLIQALIACLFDAQFNIFELQFGDCFIKELCKIVSESSAAKQFFVSKYMDYSCHPKDMIRRFTVPYLRRCALLWRLLLNSSESEPFGVVSSCGVDGSSSHVNLTASEGASTSPAGEFQEIIELENLFHIPSLEMVIKDSVVHSLALKWCTHFCEEFPDRNYGHILPSTPAVPFKLMQLPQLYQDLLQRYIKQRCPMCKNVPDEPVLCLLCGSLCSLGWKSCCRDNGCQNHAMACGAGIGVFILIRRTTVLLQRSSRQAPWPSLYLDMFGEEDIDMSRGKPLYLNEERYATLTHMVASHGLDQSSEVLRQTTMGLQVFTA